MISLIALLVVIGIALFFVGQIPMDSKILQLIRAVVILVAVLLILSWLFPGYMPSGMRSWK